MIQNIKKIRSNKQKTEAEYEAQTQITNYSGISKEQNNKANTMPLPQN